ncbi:MAG: chromosomal replication initiator protein DnaA [Deltaproteobacteria bacterium]
MLEALAQRLNDRTIDTLLRPLEALEATHDALGNVFFLQAQNEFSRDWVSRNYEALIAEHLQSVTGTAWSIFWTVKPAAAPGASPQASSAPPPVPSTPARKSQPSSPARKPMAARSSSVHTSATGGVLASPPPATGSISRGLHPKYTFEHFVTGPSNQLAHAAALASSQLVGRRFNPLFLCGDTGLGKTHLVNAIGHRLLAQKHDANIVYVSAEHFMNEFIASVRSSTMPEFRERYRNRCDALLLDDVQFLAGKEQTQEEFFHTFNALYLHEKPIVLTSDVAPQDLKGIPDRLVSRFASGLVAEIYPPELETRVAILRKKAELEGIQLTDEAAFTLANAIASNVRDLEGMLMKLAIKASLLGRSGVDISMVTDALRLPSRHTVTTVEDIQRAVCEHYRIRLAQLTGRDRHQEIALPRQVAMYLCRDRLGTSFPQLGARFGGKDHTTVISAVNKIKKLLVAGHAVRNDIDAIASRLGPKEAGR